MTSDIKDLSLILDSKVPILVIESHEEPRVLEMITGLAVTRALPMLVWSITEGLNRLGFGETAEQGDAFRRAGRLQVQHLRHRSLPQLAAPVLEQIVPYR